MKRVILLLTVALLVIGSSLNAQQYNGKNVSKKESKCSNFQNQQSGFHFERMEKRLNLTDVQITKISNLRFKHQNIVIDIKSNIQKNKLIISKMMTDNKVDKAELLKITGENNELLGKIKLSKTNMWLEVYNLLDDTQKVEWTKTFVKFSSKSKGFHKQRGNRNNDCQRVPHDRMR